MMTVIADIDNDVIANTSFVGNYNDGWIHGVNVSSWNATYSGYLYVFAYDKYFAGSSCVCNLTGMSENVALGIMDDTGTAGLDLRGWRIGYVHLNNSYSFGGTLAEPGATTCSATPVGAYQYSGNVSYSGSYTGHILSLTPGAYDPCASDYVGLVFLLIESEKLYATDKYVDIATGSDSDDGLSWANAFLTVKKGIDNVFNPDILHIAEGNYSAQAAIDLDKNLNLLCEDYGGGNANPPLTVVLPATV